MDEWFNSVFISHSSEDKTLAKKFGEELKKKLPDQTRVWLSYDIEKGKEWRSELHRRLNSPALVLVLLSPDSIKSPWVLYEWHYSLLMHQSEPYLVHFRQCGERSRFWDYQMDKTALFSEDEKSEDAWSDKEAEIANELEEITTRLQGFPALQEHYDILTSIGNDDKLKQAAADRLGNVSEGLSLAASNYLIKALQIWLSRGRSIYYGPVLASISKNLASLGTRKATPTITQFLIDQIVDYKVDHPPTFETIKHALSNLSHEEPM